MQVIRPNLGKKIMRSVDANKYLENFRPCRNINDALELWQKEFLLSDIPYETKYQVSCPGRHKETTVVCGNVVPILQKMINVFNKYGTETQKVLSIVRVETGSNEGLVKDEENTSNFGFIKATAKKSHASKKQPYLGDKVAMDLGCGILFGTIVEKNDNGDYVCDFVDQSKLSLNEVAVTSARSCFQSEIDKLIKMDMDEREASQLDEIILVKKNGKIGEPIISENEAFNDDEPEKPFETKFNATLPSVIVGIELPNKIYREKINNEVHDVSATEKLLHDLGEGAMNSGVQTALELFTQNQQISVDDRPSKKMKIFDGENNDDWRADCAIDY